MPVKGTEARTRGAHARVLALAVCAIAIASAAGAHTEGGLATTLAHATDDMGGDAPRTELYVPSRVLPEAWYYGMVRHEGPRSGGGYSGEGVSGGTMTIRLASDPAAVLAAPSVEMPPGADHAIFAFKAIERGTHTIRASAGGEFAEGTVTVIDPADDGLGLAVTLPPTTRVPRVAGAVHLVELSAGGHATAVPAASDLEVSLSGGGGILVPDSAVIPAGSTGATFDAFVAAPGTVHAYGNGMEAEARIGFEREEPPAVRVRVWPPVLPENSAGHYIAWLEDTNNRPAAAAGARAASAGLAAALVHTSDARIARAGGAPAAHPGIADRPAQVQVDGWPWLGTFRTGAAGIASLTVAVPGHGSATDWFAVGPSAYGARGIIGDNGTVMEGGAYGIGDISAAGQAAGGTAGRGVDGDEPNLVVFDVVPPAAVADAPSADGGAASGRSFIVAAAYRAYADRAAEVVGGAGRAGPGEGEGVGGAGRVEVSGAVHTLRPVIGGPVEIVVASDGAEHAATAVLGAPVREEGGGARATIPSNSAVVPVRAPPGSYEVSVTAPGMRQHPRTAPLDVSWDAGHGGDPPRLHILPLPVAPGRVQDIALLYAGDAAGAVLDPAAALGSTRTGAPAGPPAVMLEAGGGAAVSSGFATMDSPVVRVRGTPGPGGAGTLSAWSPALAGLAYGSTANAAPATESIGAWKGGAWPGTDRGAAGGPIVDVPQAVRAHEVFPAAAAPLAGGPDGTGAEIEASGGCRRAGAAEAAAALAASGGAAPDHAGAEDASPVAGRLFVCESAGRLSVFSGAAHGSADVRPYARPESPGIAARFGDIVRAGSEYMIDVQMPPAPPAAPRGTVAVDTALPHEIVDGGVLLRPDRGGLFQVAVAADAPGSTAASARLDVVVDASVTYAVEARDGSGAHLAVPVALSTASDTKPREATTPHRETAEPQAVTAEFPRTARHGDRAYELVDVRVLGRDGTAGGAPSAGGTDAGQAPSALTAEPREGDVLAATYARTVLVEAGGGAVGGGAFRAGQAVVVRAPEVHLVSFLVRSVWDGWEVRPAGGGGMGGAVVAEGQGPSRHEAAAALAAELNAQGPEASFAAADDVVVTARYREDHTGAAAAFAACGMLAVLAVFRGGMGYRLRAVQALDAAEAAFRSAWAAARRLVPIGSGRNGVGGGSEGGGGGAEGGAEWYAEIGGEAVGAPEADGPYRNVHDGVTEYGEEGGEREGTWESDGEYEGEEGAGRVHGGGLGGGGGDDRGSDGGRAGAWESRGGDVGAGGGADAGGAAPQADGDAVHVHGRHVRPHHVDAGRDGDDGHDIKEDGVEDGKAAGGALAPAGSGTPNMGRRRGSGGRGRVGGGAGGSSGGKRKVRAVRPSAAPRPTSPLPPPPPPLSPPAGAAKGAAGAGAEGAAAEEPAGAAPRDDADEAAAGAATEAALEAIRSAAASECPAGAAACELDPAQSSSAAAASPPLHSPGGAGTSPPPAPKTARRCEEQPRRGRQGKRRPGRAGRGGHDKSGGGAGGAGGTVQ